MRIPGSASVHPPARRTAVPGETVSDMDLIEAVLKLAKDPGYVLVGDTGTVWRRRTRSRCPRLDRAADQEASPEMIRNLIGAVDDWAVLRQA